MTSAPALWRVENGGGVGWGALGFADYCQTSSQFSERPLFQGIKMERGSQMETPDILLVSCTRVPAPSHMCSHPTHKTHTVKVNTMKKQRLACSNSKFELDQQGVGSSYLFPNHADSDLTSSRKQHPIS